MSVTLEVGIVGIYLVIALAIGVVAFRRTGRTAADFYLADRNLGTVVLLFTTFATLLSAFTFFGGPNLAYGAGPEWILVMGVMDGVLFAILWYLIGYKQWLIGQRQGYMTLGEMLGDRFGSRRLRGLVAGISLFWLFPYVMLQQKGAGTAIQALTDGTVPFWMGAAGITTFMILYVIVAGMQGVAWTDTLQGLFMLVVIWGAVVWVLAAAGGLRTVTASLPSGFLSLGGAPAPGAPYSPAFIISSAVTIAFGVAMFPQINQRFFVARSKAVLKRTFTLWPVLVVLLFLPAFMLGAWARGLGVTVPEGGNVLPALLSSYTPVWFAALVTAGAMAAMMSSSDSMLLSGTSYLTRDLYRPFINPGATERREDFVARIGVVVFASGSFVASLVTPGSLVQIGQTAFGGFAQLSLPVLVALYWPETTRSGIFAGITVSQLFYLASVFMSQVPTTLPGGWDAGLLGMVLGLVLTLVVSIVTGTAPEENSDVYFGSTGAD